jgi:hypothetical protein
MSLLLIPVAIVAVSALVFFVTNKSGKAKGQLEVKPEAEPIGYEAALVPALEVIRLKKVEKKKVSKNTPKQEPLARMEAKAKKAIKARK